MYDLIIIGSGPGGYIAAERAGAKKLKTLLIEKEKLGGVCLNWGCIPTKTLLNSAKLYYQCNTLDSFGVKASGASYDFSKAMEWKAEVVSTLQGGIASLMKRFNVDVKYGTAHIVSRNKVNVDGTVYEAKAIIVATGSEAALPPIPGLDGDNVVTNREILSLDTLPKKLAVIGGGVIGVEFATYFSKVGVEVSVIEMLDEILPSIDKEASKELRKSMKGVNFHLSNKVVRVEKDAVIHVDKDGNEKRTECDLVLCATGRIPNTKDLGLEAAGVDTERGWIKVDDTMRTNVSSIYAIGDVTGRSLLAHSASRMGEVAVAHIAGEKDVMRYEAVPGVVYTFPEVASVGVTEAEAREKGLKVKTAKFPMKANGRFLAENGRHPGFCKVIADAETDVILGVHLFGQYSSEIISSAVLMIEAELRTADVRETVFPHPTVSEVIRDTLFGMVH